MTEAKAFYTRTLADLFVRQGHYRKAVDVYRHLLSETPGDRGLMDALKAAEAKRNQGEASKSRKPVDLFCQWFDLVNQSNRLKRLRRLRHDLRFAMNDPGVDAQAGQVRDKA